METTATNYRDNNNGGKFDTNTFELRGNQMYLRDALALTIEDMVKDQPKDKHTLSRADIILIFTIYTTLESFYNKYMNYVRECANAEYLYCQPPHYFLKYQIG